MATVLPVADINQDGKCSLSDLVLMNHYLAGELELTETQVQALDIYQDGTVNANDSVILAQFLLRMVVSLPVKP
jgi:hypothetical protein